MMSEERILLGSGTLYYKEFADEIPTDEVIEVEGNLLGLIQGGATLRYTPTFYIAKDDFGKVMKKIITEEEAVLTSGIMTFNANRLKTLVQTGVVTETATERQIKIGGLGNFVDRRYVLHFVHKDDMDGDVRITIVGSNEGALELAFRKDQETIINAEFKASPIDDEGTLIIYREEIAGTRVESVSLDESSITLEVGNTDTLVATVLPSTAVDKTYTFSTSNEAVATVSSVGLVTAIGVGEAVITVTTTDGSKTATCSVTVELAG